MARSVPAQERIDRAACRLVTGLVPREKGAHPQVSGAPSGWLSLVVGESRGFGFGFSFGAQLRLNFFLPQIAISGCDREAVGSQAAVIRVSLLAYWLAGWLAGQFGTLGPCRMML